jgi:hypothetical protein
MRTMHQPALIPIILLLSAVSVTAEADDMVAITITNDHTNDILVTVRDLNTEAHTKVLQGQRISGFASVPVSITAGAGGTGHVSWHATTADGDVRKCGHKDRPGLANNDSVHVHANSTCPASVPR